MVKINRKLEYAIMALKVLNDRAAMQGQDGGLTTVKEVCDLLLCSYDGMARVMQKMAHGQQIKGQELLVSEQGIGGGYRLNRNLDQVSMYSLMEVVLGPIEIARCLQQNKSCQMMKTCNIVSPINALNLKITEFYKTLSMAEIFSVSENVTSLMGQAQQQKNEIRGIAK